MRRLVLVAALAIGLVVGWSAGAGVSFTRGANTSAGRAVYESGPVTLTNLDPADTWHYAGQDILPFDYEQGVAYAGGGSLVFSSRGSLVRTSLGCPDPVNLDSPCYDVQAENLFATKRSEFEQGFNHIGGIDVGLAGPAQGFVFAPLEKSPGTKNARGYLAFDLALQRAGTRLETVAHLHHSWVTVDPSGHWLIAADESIDPVTGKGTIRVHQINRQPDEPVPLPEERIQIDPPDPDLAVTVDPAGGWPNFAGCSFAGLKRLYCSNWKDQGDFDVETEIYRLDLSAPVGAPGATATTRLVLRLHLAQRFTPRPVVLFAMETEGLTFYPQTPGGENQMHVLLRGERLDSFYFVHLSLGPAGS